MEKNYCAQLVGLFGYPAEGNATVVMEEAAFQALGLNFRYVTYSVHPDDLPEAVRALTALNMRGINLTAPHKVEVMKYLDSVSESARIIGAVNTIVIDNKKLHGENTDGKGFLKSLENAQVTIKGEKIDILGAGGAARAVAVELALAGASRVNIINRQERRGAELSALISENTPAQSSFIAWNQPYSIAADTQILINCTTVGMLPNYEQKPNLDYTTIRSDMLVCDVVPNPPITQFLKEASMRGAKTIDGLGMLINQGAMNFTLWTELAAPIDIMRCALENEFHV